MLSREYLGCISISHYIREIEVSKAQRDKYYEWDNITIKSGSKKLLQKYINPFYKDDIIINNGNIRPRFLAQGYCIVGFKGDKVYSIISDIETEHTYTLLLSYMKKPTKYILCQEVSPKNYIKVLANETQAGKPKMQIINGNYIYNNKLNPFTVGKMFDAIKDMYYNKFKSIDKAKLEVFRNALNLNYPLIIEMEIVDTIKNKFDNSKNDIGKIWDVGNRADPYMKTFYDFITKGHLDIEPLIKEDDRLHIASGNNTIFTPIEPFQTPKLVFKFYADRRPCWNNYKEFM